ARQVEPRLVVGGAALGGHEVIPGEALFGHPWAGPGEGAGAGGDGPAALIPTSGTTGRSKLVRQTPPAYVLAGGGDPGGRNARRVPARSRSPVSPPANAVPGSVAARASLVLLPRFSASTFIDSARRYGATEFNAIGAMLEILMRQPERADDAGNPLRRC